LNRCNTNREHGYNTQVRHKATHLRAPRTAATHIHTPQFCLGSIHMWDTLSFKILQIKFCHLRTATSICWRRVDAKCGFSFLLSLFSLSLSPFSRLFWLLTHLRSFTLYLLSFIFSPLSSLLYLLSFIFSPLSSLLYLLSFIFKMRLFVPVARAARALTRKRHKPI